MKKIIKTFRFFNLFLLLKKRKKKTAAPIRRYTFSGLSNTQVAAFASEFWTHTNSASSNRQNNTSAHEIQLLNAIYDYNHIMMQWKSGENKTVELRRSVETARKKLEMYLRLRKTEMDQLQPALKQATGNAPSNLRPAKQHSVELKKEKINLRKKKK